MRPCDKEFNLYEMVDVKGAESRSREITCNTNSACTRLVDRFEWAQFKVYILCRKMTTQYVPHTNLMLVIVVKNTQCSCPESRVSIEPEEIEYTEQRRCQLLGAEKYRKRPSSCHNYHPQVSDCLLMRNEQTCNHFSISYRKKIYVSAAEVVQRYHPL